MEDGITYNKDGTPRKKSKKSTKMYALNIKQLKFLEHYQKHGNAVQAFIEAGYTNKYPGKNAYAVLNSPAIQRLIKQQQTKIIRRMDISREKIIARQNKRSELIDQLHDLALKDELTDVEQEKYDRLVQIIKTSDANKSDEILNKMLGFNEPEKTEVKHTWSVDFGSSDDNSDEEE